MCGRGRSGPSAGAIAISFAENLIFIDAADAGFDADDGVVVLAPVEPCQFFDAGLRAAFAKDENPDRDQLAGDDFELSRRLLDRFIRVGGFYPCRTASVWRRPDKRPRFVALTARLVALPCGAVSASSFVPSIAAGRAAPSLSVTL
jgi:hypothetical protein